MTALLGDLFDNPVEKFAIDRRAGTPQSKRDNEFRCKNNTYKQGVRVGTTIAIAVRSIFTVR
jgi:hypothetical protein